MGKPEKSSSGKTKLSVPEDVGEHVSSIFTAHDKAHYRKLIKVLVVRLDQMPSQISSVFVSMTKHVEKGEGEDKVKEKRAVDLLSKVIGSKGATSAFDDALKRLLIQMDTHSEADGSTTKMMRVCLSAMEASPAFACAVISLMLQTKVIRSRNVRERMYRTASKSTTLTSVLSSCSFGVVMSDLDLLLGDVTRNVDGAFQMLAWMMERDTECQYTEKIESWMHSLDKPLYERMWQHLLSIVDLTDPLRVAPSWGRVVGHLVCPQLQANPKIYAFWKEGGELYASLSTEPKLMTECTYDDVNTMSVDQIAAANSVETDCCVDVGSGSGSGGSGDGVGSNGGSVVELAAKDVAKANASTSKLDWRRDVLLQLICNPSIFGNDAERHLQSLCQLCLKDSHLLDAISKKLLSSGKRSANMALFLRLAKSASESVPKRDLPIYVKDSDDAVPRGEVDRTNKPVFPALCEKCASLRGDIGGGNEDQTEGLRLLASKRAHSYEEGGVGGEEGGVVGEEGGVGGEEGGALLSLPSKEATKTTPTKPTAKATAPTTSTKTSTLPTMATSTSCVVSDDASKGERGKRKVAGTSDVVAKKQKLNQKKKKNKNKKKKKGANGNTTKP